MLRLVQPFLPSKLLAHHLHAELEQEEGQQQRDSRIDDRNGIAPKEALIKLGRLPNGEWMALFAKRVVIVLICRQHQRLAARGSIVSSFMIGAGQHIEYRCWHADRDAEYQAHAKAHQRPGKPEPGQSDRLKQPSAVFHRSFPALERSWSHELLHCSASRFLLYYIMPQQ